MISTVQVLQKRVSTQRVVQQPLPALQEGEAVFKIEKFGFTANNVTYAVLGAAYKYFDFFPLSKQDGGDQWAVTPTWGLATVTATRSAHVQVGQRVYGYLPMASHVILKPGQVSAQGSFYVDRPQLPPDRKVYNQYFLCTKDPFYMAKAEDHMMLYRPLFFTSLFLDDYLSAHEFFDSKTIVITSASSKTSFALAFLLHANRAGIKVVGLTSPRNASFVRSLGCYHKVMTYAEVGQMDKSEPTALVDVAGNSKVRASLARTLGDNFKAGVLVGQAHWSEGKGDEMPPRCQLFFAPGWIKKRQAEWGPVKSVQMMVKGWRQFMDSTTRAKVVISRRDGGENALNVFSEQMTGKCPADLGYVLSLHRPCGQKKSNL